MAVSNKTVEFLKSAQATEIKKELTRMMGDPQYNTRARYSPQANGDMTFVDKHITYLSRHLEINPDQYLSNLRLITKYN